MKRRIFLSLMVIAIAAALVAGATTSYFSDVESANGTLTAGTLDLRVNDKDGNVGTFNLDNIFPGYESDGYIKLSNVGTLNGIVKITGATVTNYENGINEPESAYDDTPNEGELGDRVHILLYFTSDNAASTSTALESPDDFELSASHAGSYFGKINGLTNISNWNLSKDLNAGKSVYLYYKIKWFDQKNTSDNIAQTDKCSVTLNFNLYQSNND